VGGMIPFIFSALCIQAVGKAAMDMVQEVRRQFREIPGIMEYKAKPEYEKCVAISTKASIREMMMPGAIALITPLIVGFVFGPEVLGGLLAGVTVSGVLMGIFQSNAGGAWDNAKKSFEKGVLINGEMFYKKSEPHKASVTGDTVGDPFKDTSGPSMNILIKLMSIVSLVIAPYIAVNMNETKACCATEEVIKCNINGQEYTCTSKAQCDSIMTANQKDIAELTGLYNVDGSHSAVDFSIKHIVTNTKGSALIDSGWVNLQNEGTKIYIQIAANSLNTQSAGRDEHIKGADFFDAAKFPKMIFEASEIVKDTTGMAYGYIAKGKMTIKGVTKDADVKFNYIGIENKDYTKDGGGKFKVGGFEGTTVIDRTQYGVGKSGGLNGLGDNVTINITLEVMQPMK
jgi:polyisoprenoid-binding protein YceI